VEHVTLFGELVCARAQKSPDRRAIECGNDALTYGQLRDLVEDVASRLAAAHVQAGAGVVVVLPNSIDYVIAILAVTALGAFAIPAPPGASADRVRYLVETTQPRLCIVAGGESEVGGVPTFRIDRGQASEIAADVRATAPLVMTAPGQRTAIVLFSSGSTGRPKGVVLSHETLLATARALSSLFGLDESHRELIIAPMCHSDGWQRVAATLLAGGSVVVPTRPLSPPAIIDAVSALDINGFFLPPPSLRLILRSAPEIIREKFASVRTLEIGSAPFTAEELRRVAELIPTARVFFHYGLTECSRAIVLDVRAYSDKLETVGRARPGVEIKICDDAGAPQAIGKPGEIYLRGPRQSEMYWQLPELNRERFLDGWLKTGDYGALDADGFLTLLGRQDDMITSAGYHFFPAEVETELGPVPGVVDYLIAGIPDPSGILEQIPVAFAVPEDPSAFQTDAFIAHARTRVPGHMVPRRVVALPALPVTPSGKPDRRSAAQRYLRAQT
jgi:fatty-acyl-CoA synthase